MRYLVLCTGNRCRSQMAHGNFSTSILSRKSIRLHYPKNVSEYLGQSWDYVITVCGGAKENCPSFTGIVKTHRHIGFDDPDAFI